MDPHFACNYLLSREAQGRLDLAVVGTTRAEISIHVLKKFSFPSPDFQYQRKVAQIMSELQEREGSERIVLAKLQAVRRGLLEDLLSGRVRVPIEADS
jgi:type I restriction enzyme S subunit